MLARIAARVQRLRERRGVDPDDADGDCRRIRSSRNPPLWPASAALPARESRRLCGDAIIPFRERGAWFKFVVGGERDVEEVLAIQSRYGLPSRRILLMPLGMRREEQTAAMPDVVGWCRRRFSPRLHILLWGARRGV